MRTSLESHDSLIKASGKFFKEDPRQPSMWFAFCPDPSHALEDEHWYAALAVKCDDVPRLLQDGLECGSRNVVLEQEYIGEPETNLARTDGRKYAGTRHYFLKDTYHPPRWIATIQVHAVHRDILLRFDLSRLVQDRVKHVIAENQHQELIYMYKHGDPKAHFNAIYDGKAMKGVWPWPTKHYFQGGI
ncbi:hypothetical protein F4825DRAFT_457085 [Nemania diffusa]|nr:hypothetical protein F4825DRAFT_457085 [Nemania diffusa]